MKQIKFLLIAALLAVVVSSCAERETERDRWINYQMEQMTLRQQIAQLFVVHVTEGSLQRRISEVYDEQLGGIIVGRVTPTGGINVINELQSQVRVPLLVTMDAEWGISMRVDSVIRFPQQLKLGAIQDLNLIYQMGLEMARQCRLFGVHMNFAPVVDVNNNPNNPIISMRSFGEDPHKVTERAYQIMRGMHDGGILTSLKHFPGHGDTDLDSHHTLPEIPHCRARLDEVELFPFRELVRRGATGVMTAHLLVPALCDENVIVSQSRAVVHDLLVEEMGFQGLIVTDALNMVGAIYGRDRDRVALYSLIAGNHILEMPIDVRASITVIEEAVNSGEIELELVQNAARKILGAKFDLGLNKGFEPINPHGILERLNTPAAYDLRMRLSEAALTLAANRDDVLPLYHTEAQNVRHLIIGQGDYFKNQLHEIAGIESDIMAYDFTPAQFNAVARNLHDVETIIVSYHRTPGLRYSFASSPVNESVVNFVQTLAQNHHVILVFFRNPYDFAGFTQPELFASVIMAYDNSVEAQISSAKAIFGQLPFLGRLPITINEHFAENHGIIMRAQHPPHNRGVELE